MNDLPWFKTPSDLISDPRWRMIAKKAQVRLCEVVALVADLWRHAGRHDGSLSTYDPELAAAALDVEESTVAAILAAMAEKALIVAGRLADWARLARHMVVEYAEAKNPIGAQGVAKNHRMRRWREQSGLSSSEWRRRRQAVFGRDGGRCVKCGSEDRLHCDHIIELRDGGSSEEPNLQTLCNTCHSRKTVRTTADRRQMVLPDIVGASHAHNQGASHAHNQASPPTPPSSDPDLKSPPYGPPHGGESPLRAKSHERAGTAPSGQIEILLPIRGGRHGQRETRAERKERENLRRRAEAREITYRAAVALRMGRDGGTGSGAGR